MKHRRVKRLFMEFGKTAEVYTLGKSLTEHTYSLYQNPYSMLSHIVDSEDLNARKFQFNRWNTLTNGRIKRFKAIKER